MAVALSQARNQLPRGEKRRQAMKIKTKVKAGIDTVPLPEMPSLRFFKSTSAVAIGTWPTPE